MNGFMIGLWEIIGILLLIAVIYLVGKKAPSLGRNIGRTIKEFKQGITQVPEEIKKGMEDEPVTPKDAKKKSAKKKKTNK